MSKDKSWQSVEAQPWTDKPTNRFDIYSLKGAIDDDIALYLEKHGFVEDTKTVDVKIVLYAIACGLAYWSHFVLKFPKEFEMVIVAVFAYGVISAIHYILENWVEK